jgi:hypothetical protein
MADEKLSYIIRHKGDLTFEHGAIHIFISDKGGMAIVANRGFEVLTVKEPWFQQKITKSSEPDLLDR